MASAAIAGCPLWAHVQTHAPQQTMPSLDHLVGEGEQLRRHLKTKSLGCPEIDHEFEFRGSRDRQIGRLLALEYSPSVDADFAYRIGKAGGVAHQPTAHDGLAQSIARRQRMASR